MLIERLIAVCGATRTSGSMDIDVTSICADSRQAVEGSLFIAVRGYAGDGHAYIGQAIEKGAKAIVYESPEAVEGKDFPEDICLVRVKDSRYAEAMIAAEFYGNPSEKLSLVGITGTNGKTTTVTLLYDLFRRLGYRCGLLSTIANYVGDKMLPTANTTADPITINRLLAWMVDEGCEYCFMEVSSIGVEQERVAGLHFKVGIFSNLTHDHLDYHKTFAEYLRCKKLFFDNLPADAFAVTNADDRNGMVMVQNTKAQIVTYSCRSMADHTCQVMEMSMEGMKLNIDGREVWTELVGVHNTYNLLAIYTTAILLGAGQENALVAISALKPVRGRLEVLRGPKGISVVIDYAHTPDALDNVLKTLTGIGRGCTYREPADIVCLFGCGGDRDKTKRPEMAQAAEKYADRIIVTSDNSRTEDTQAIMNDIKEGFSPAGMCKTLFIQDRKEAIRTAIIMARPGSVILLAGKGHETYQIIGKEKSHFDEGEIVSEIFHGMAGDNK